MAGVEGVDGVLKTDFKTEVTEENSFITLLHCCLLRKSLFWYYLIVMKL